MKFNPHHDLEGQHAILSPSRYHWLNYDEEKLVSWVAACRAMSEGIEIHDFAKRCIERGVKLPKRRKTLNKYVNDVIDHKLTPEQVLYYSPSCFGTTDAIGVKENVLYIFDLKTGSIRADFKQLYIYAGLFALEYPDVWAEIDEVVLRIYQSNDYREEIQPSAFVEEVADKIVKADHILRTMD